ncbi:hypothetical protein AVEN_26717-1 [Araneus ventricosus]|uniref:Uncharacterized protein n=1 Tax=Araneus ventricosus TaxID=182803 RepID=A0A4Y2RUQ7_ARAVE|nr:hypothetical protein AVEN_26717-1 [Araneus ventricosus]
MPHIVIDSLFCTIYDILIISGIPITSKFTSSSSSSDEGLALGLKIGIPIVSILVFICYWYCICRCCCACCRKETPGVVVTQSNIVQNQQPEPFAPQIILHQPISQQAPPMYDAQQTWAQPPPQGQPQWSQPPPQGQPQWSQPPQGPPQWAPHPMSKQQQYSPNSGYDNAAFKPATAQPPYNTGKY